MNYQQNVPGVGTSAAPAICTKNGDIYMAWKGAGTDPGIYWSIGKTPGSMLPQTKITNIATSNAPAIASYNNSIYMAWVGEGTDESLYFSKLAGSGVVDTFSLNWAPQTSLQGGSSDAPALIGTSKALYLVWKEESGGTRIFWSKSEDGKTWTPQENIKSGSKVAGTNTAPALAVHGDDVYVCWKDESDTDIWWSKCSDGKTWSAHQHITAGTGHGPALTCDSNGVIWMACTVENNAGDGGIRYSSLVNESKNQWKVMVDRYGVGTSDRPALVSTPGGADGIIMAWKGAGNDGGIYYGPLLLPAVAYNIKMINFQILNTRSGSAASFITSATDTDYGSLSYSINGGTPQQVTQSFGDHSNGTVATNLELNNIKLSDTDIIAFSYHITNSSQGPGVALGYVNTITSKLLDAYFSVVNEQLDTAGIPIPITTPDEKAAFIGAQIGGALIPLIGTALGAVAGWLTESFWGVLFPNCDGPVATAIHSYTGAQLRGMLTPIYPNAYMTEDKNPGANSPDGCGSNSNYKVTWMIQMQQNG